MSKEIRKSAFTQLNHLCELESRLEESQRRLVSIIATISRASRNADIIYGMLQKGVNIFRLNFSHESHELHSQTIDLVQSGLQRLKTETGQTVSVAFAVDTRGPQIRTGLLEGGNDITLRNGETIRLSINKDLYDKGGKEAVYVDYPNIINVAKPEDRIFVDDGKIFMTILEVGVDGLVCEVIQGGVLGNNCNVILPEVEIDLPTVSEKDMDDLQFSVRSNVDIVFASGLRGKKNLKELRQVLGDKGKRIKIIAKIDSKIALSRYQELMESADGLLLSRADLGTQIPMEKLFITQKSVTGHCNKAGKPVIIASNILESMRSHPFPTRAECFDLANAVIDGADCIMLSSEVAIGRYPMETIDTCDTLCREAEKVLWYRNLFDDLVHETRGELDASHSIAITAVETAGRTKAKLIIVLTTSGRSAALLSKYRPVCPVLAVTRCETAARWVNLHRGILPLLYPNPCAENDINARVSFALTCARKSGLIADGDPIVIVSAWKEAGFTNNVRIVYSFFETDKLDCLFREDEHRAAKNTDLQSKSGN